MAVNRVDILNIAVCQAIDDMQTAGSTINEFKSGNDTVTSLTFPDGSMIDVSVLILDAEEVN